MGSQSTKSGSNKNWRGYSGSYSIESVEKWVKEHYKDDLEKEMRDKFSYWDSLNEEEKKELRKVPEDNYKSKHKIKLKTVYYNYKAIGSHRFIELYVTCSGCSYSKYVRLDKTEDGKKNAVIFDGPFNVAGWWYWKYEPKETTFDDCMRYAKNARPGYHKLANNCADFARYIWNRLE